MDWEDALTPRPSLYNAIGRPLPRYAIMSKVAPGRRPGAGETFMPTSRLFALAAFVAMAFASAPAMAQGWGAIAFSPSTGATGYTWDNVNEVDAELRALQFCDQNAGDCESAITFRNACGAVAWGKNGGWGSGWDTDEESARQVAMNECSLRDDGCRIMRWQCSGNY